MCPSFKCDCACKSFKCDYSCKLPSLTPLLFCVVNYFLVRIIFTCIRNPLKRCYCSCLSCRLLSRKLLSNFTFSFASCNSIRRMQKTTISPLLHEHQHQQQQIKNESLYCAYSRARCWRRQTLAKYPPPFHIRLSWKRPRRHIPRRLHIWNAAGYGNLEPILCTTALPQL